MKDCEEHKIADIQHRDIQDSELHELKGAAGAILGSVPVANGVGGTDFQKLGVSNFSGSIPTGVPDIVLATDGFGGFKGASGASGRLSYEITGSFPTPSTESMSAATSLTGMFIDGVTVKVTESGLYLYGVSHIALLTPESGPTTITWPSLVDAGNNVIFSGIFGIVSLTNTQAYKLSATGNFSLWKIVV